MQRQRKWESGNTNWRTLISRYRRLFAAPGNKNAARWTLFWAVTDTRVRRVPLAVVCSPVPGCSPSVGFGAVGQEESRAPVLSHISGGCWKEWAVCAPWDGCLSLGFLSSGYWWQQLDVLFTAGGEGRCIEKNKKGNNLLEVWCFFFFFSDLNLTGFKYWAYLNTHIFSYYTRLKWAHV